MNDTTLYDITIIGGGPVGLFAGFYAGMRQAKTKIIESLALTGGQPAHLYPEKFIYDVPAHYSLTGQQLADNLQQQLTHFNTTICTDEQALSIERVPHLEHPYFCITTTKGTHLSKAVIIAIGNGAFQPRKLKLPMASHYESHSLHYFVQNPEQFRDRTVAICGGGDSAIDWALTLAPIAKSVYLIHRRPEFRAMAHNVNLLQQSDVQILTPFVPHELIGEGQQLSQLVIKASRGDDTITLDINDFIVSYGFVSSIGPVATWGLDMSRQSILTYEGHMTSQPGIYAIGDVATYSGKTKLIATGFGEATVAINHALQQIYPERHQPPVHSTSLFEA